MPDSPYIGITLANKETGEDKLVLTIDLSVREDGVIVYSPQHTDRPEKHDLDVCVTLYTPTESGTRTTNILRTGQFK